MPKVVCDIMGSKKDQNNKTLKNDLFILIVFLLISGCLFIVFKNPSRTDGDYALITVNGEEYARLDLDEDTDITVSTDNGINSVHVSDGMISVISADCPDQICVNHEAIGYDKETIVCLPHKLVIEICSEKEADVDAISQ